LAYIDDVLTVVETPTFAKQADVYWVTQEREEFIDWIARNHDAGDVIPASGGCRKIRWGAKGRGKSGGLRVIYYNMLADGRLVLLLVYGKNVMENIPGPTLKLVQEKIHASFGK
jgi:mRNA-degrading endonuclease RelE of RelBE toxin-antitoxin system